MKHYKVIFALAAFSLVALGMTDTINIKPGLWEVTTTTQTKGTPPMSAEEKAEMEKAMAKMTPERRAQMEAALKAAQSGNSRPTVRKSCITKEDLSKPFAFDAGKDDGSCTRTIIKSTSSEQEVRMDCTNKTRKSSGTVRVVAANPESWNGTMDATVSDTGGTMVLKSSFSGKWLGAACGDVKPMSHK